MLDEILLPVEPASIVLKYLNTDLLQESRRERLSRPEVKRVARAILSALKPLHKDGMVHTDVKLDNIFVNYGSLNQLRFADIQLRDLGAVVHQDSEFAREGHLIGTSISRSPEATLQLHWGTATDAWSFGNAVSNAFLMSEGITSSRNDLEGSNDVTNRSRVREIPAAGKTFILKVIKLDPRERPTVKELLEDGWFTEELEDTRTPL